MTSLAVTGLAASATIGSIININSTTSYRNVSWTPSFTDIGVYTVKITATDNINQITKSTFNLSVINPNIIPLSVQPSDLLNSTVLLGVNGFITFQVTYSASITRPVLNAYTRIVHQNGTEIAKVNNKDPAQVTFNVNSFTFKLPIYMFTPANYSYILDDGVTLESQIPPKRCNNSAQSSGFSFVVPQSSL